MILILVLGCLWFPACHANESVNIAIAQSMVDAINGRDLSALDEIVAPNVVRKSAATAGVTINNLNEFKAFLESDFLAVPDSVMKIDVIFGNDQFVALRAVYSGTQTGQMGPFPPSDKYFELPFVGILKFQDGKISEIWVEWDNVYALTQMGHLSQPEE
jgi:predicted ester cyclase